MTFCIFSGIEWEFVLLCVLRSTDIDKVWDLSYSNEFAMAPHCYFSLKCLHDVSDGKFFLSHSLVLKSQRRLMGCFTCMWVPLSHGVKGEMKEQWQLTFLCSLGHHDTSCFVPPWLPIVAYWALWNCGQKSTLTPLSGFCRHLSCSQEK